MPLLVRNIRKHKSGRVDYRLTIPKELRPFVPGGVTNFIRSLGKEGGPEFGKRLDAAKGEGAALIARAEKQRDGAFDRLDSPTIAYLAEAYRSHWIRKGEQAHWHPKNWGGAWGDAQWGVEERSGWARLQREAVLHAQQDRKEVRALGDVKGLLEAWTPVALALASERGLLIDPADSVPFLALCRALNDAAIQAGEMKLRRLDGEGVLSPPDPERPTAVIPADTVKRARVPLLETFEAYANEQGISPGVRNEWQHYLRKLVEFLGHDDAVRLTAENVVAWKDHLLTEPTRTGGKRSAVTVNDKYLTSLKGTLSWAVDQKKLPENVAKGIRARVPNLTAS